MLVSGLNLDCGNWYNKFLAIAMNQGKTREEYVDRSLKYLYIVLMRLGYFDGIPQYESLGRTDICTGATIELATEAAREGIVLLKNEHNALPLTMEFRTIALVGPHANATTAMIGNYAGIISTTKKSLLKNTMLSIFCYSFFLSNICHRDSVPIY